jgi:hypothetical protein
MQLLPIAAPNVHTFFDCIFICFMPKHTPTAREKCLSNSYVRLLFLFQWNVILSKRIPWCTGSASPTRLQEDTAAIYPAAIWVVVLS